MTRFQFKVRVKGRRALTGVIAEIFNEDGDLLDSLDLDAFRKKFTFDFDQDQALKGKNRADLAINLTDINGDGVNLRKRNGGELDLDDDEQSFSIAISARKQSRRVILRPTGNLQTSSSDAPDSLSGSISSDSDDVLLNNIMLSAGQDIYSDVIGGSLIDGEFIENMKRLTSSVDVVNASPGSLGENDDLFDATAKDGDQLNLGSNVDDSLEHAIGNVGQVVGLEILNISASDDTSVNVDFAAFQGLESVSVFGAFTEQVVYKNYLMAGARSFDFSGIYAGGVNLSDNSLTTNDAITLIGSNGDDILHANNGVAEIRGGGGNDTIQGSMIVGGVIAGGPGNDTGLILYASHGAFANAVHIGTIDDFPNFVATTNVEIV